MNPRTTDHLCWLLIIVALLLLLCGCEPGHPYVQAKCTSAEEVCANATNPWTPWYMHHRWSPWTNTMQPHSSGYCVQSRTCTICGFQYYEVH